MLRKAMCCLFVVLFFCVVSPTLFCGDVIGYYCADVNCRASGHLKSKSSFVKYCLSLIDGRLQGIQV